MATVAGGGGVSCGGGAPGAVVRLSQGASRFGGGGGGDAQRAALRVSSAAAVRPVVARARSVGVKAMGGKVDPTDTWWLNNTAPNMHEINGTAEFLAALAGAGDKLVIVDFYAKWCGSCRALYPKLCKIMGDEANANVVFLKLDFDENKPIAKTLGVKMLPYFLMYRGTAGKVAEFSCSLTKISKLRDAIAVHNSEQCFLPVKGGAAAVLPELEKLAEGVK